jgi:Ca-activated chloride channel family protein
MNSSRKHRLLSPLETRLLCSVAGITFVVASFWAWRTADRSFANLWLSPDEQGDRLMREERYAEAADRYRDPVRKGVALYRGEKFDEAAAAFGRAGTADAAYDRGNALVFQGKYLDAIASYERALKLRPDWSAARSNRDLAAARQKKAHPPGDASEGTDGQIKADEYVFDNKPKQAGAQDEEVVAGGPMSDDDIQALWLRRVQTKPADFLRAKFAYQLSRQSSQEPAK